MRIMLWLDALAHRYCDWFERWLLRHSPRVAHEPVAWSCDHVTMTSGGTITNPRFSCGCDMKPVY